MPIAISYWSPCFYLRKNNRGTHDHFQMLGTMDLHLGVTASKIKKRLYLELLMLHLVHKARDEVGLGKEDIHNLKKEPTKGA